LARLRRADCAGPGIRRRRRGRGFEYSYEDGRRVRDRATLARIAELAIPPAWRDVWICLDANGHIQATGLDAAGRKQYLYHQRWRAHRDRAKFEKVLRFARALPRLRRRIAADLEGEGLGREQVLACAVRLLDLGFFRIGGERYADENQSYGLATMRKDHVSVSGDEVAFDFDAKSGVRRLQSVVDGEVADVVRALRRRRGGGPDLLAYKEGRRWRNVRSNDINDYVKEAAGEDFSAKDFRTWNATVLAAVALARHDDPALTKTARKRRANEAVKAVAGYLGNTPAVCRSAYIDPRVFDRFDAGQTIAPTLRRLAGREGTFADRAAIERAVVRLLD
jgi:DNA topoisomerase-1